jgi:hypothetical protein
MRKEAYGPEVKNKHGLDLLFEWLSNYESSDGASPLKPIYEGLQQGKSLLDVGSGWEKEAVDAQAMFGPEVRWVAMNPMLAIEAHNRRVEDMIDERTWDSHVQRALKSFGIESPTRSALAAESSAMPFAPNSFDILLASWSVPTVLEEQIKNATGNDVLQEKLREKLQLLLQGSCAEYARVLRNDGVAVTFPIRDPDIVKQIIIGLDEYADWEHTICTAPDSTDYVVDDNNPVSYLLMSKKIGQGKSRGTDV